MARVYTIKRKSLTAGVYESLAPRSATNRQAITYDILASDDAAPLEPLEATELEILDAPGLPKVNQSIFEFDGGGVRQIQPWLICTSKRATRDADARTLWRVISEYQAPNLFSLTEDELKLINCPNTVADYPWTVEKIWGEETKVLWSEAVGANPKALRLPTNTMYAEPFRRRYPARVIRQSQFESHSPGTIDAVIDRRLLTTNDIAFQGDPIPSDPNTDPNATFFPPRWLITNIQYQKLSAPIGPGTVYDVNAYLMTYTIERSSLPGGWWERRALIDRFYLQVAGDINTRIRYADPYDQSRTMQALLFVDGTLKPEDVAAQQNGEPDYQNYVVQPEGGTTVDGVAHDSWTYLKQ